MSRNLPKPWTDEVHGSESHQYEDAQSRDGLLDLGLRFFDLARRNWLLLILFVVGAIGIVEYQGRTRRPTYRAHAVIQLRDRAGMLTGGIANDARATSGSDAMLSQIQVLHSRAVAQAVVDKLGMRLRAKDENGALIALPAAIDDVYVAPDAPPATLHLVFGSSTVTTTGLGHAQAKYDTPLELGKVRLTVHSNPGVGNLELSVIPTETAVDEVLASLHGQPRERTSILDVTAVSHDPVTAQRVANAAVVVFQDLTAKNEKQESVRRREFIQQQVAKAEAQLSEAQLQYNRFMSRGEELGSADRLRVHQSALADIESRKQDLESQQHSYLTMLDSLRNPAHDEMYRERLSVLVSSPGIAGNPLVTSLYAELGRFEAARDTVMIGPVALAAGNPEVRRLDTLIATTRSGLLRAVSLQVASMSARINALEDLQQKFSQGLSSLPTLEVQQATLQASVETYRRQTERLRDAFQNAQIEEAAQGGQVEIVDLATPAGAPIETGKAPRFVLAILLALALATTTAYILENHKDVIRRREELAVLTPLPNLALVPRFRKLPAANRWLPFGAREVPAKTGMKPTVVAPAPTKQVVTVADMHSPGAEAYRTLRTNLLFSAAVQSLHRVIVTSAAPREGKSTTAANLAAACAQQGQKVLIIDCDLRGPTVHTLFNRQRAPGLTNVLIGTVSLEDALGQTNLPELSVLTAGTTPPNPAELLGSPKMAKLLDDLAVRFDLIIIDTPPLLAASDAAILGRIADGTLMVVRAGQTQRIAVQEAIQQLHTVGARVLGTVLNDPDAEIAKFAPYYYQYYQSYYHARSSRV